MRVRREKGFNRLRKLVRMRIYRVDIEHKEFGRNYDSHDIAAGNFDELVKRVKIRLKDGERIESVELLASED